MAQKTVALIGSTGLIGSHLLEQLTADPAYETIRILVRNVVGINHPKIEMKLVNFSDYESVQLAIDGCQAVFCAVGTTQKKVKGDLSAYRKVDFDIPVDTARACVETGCGQFHLVSAVGANSNSTNFYLKLKGEVEDAVTKLSIGSVSFFRPSMLLGQRKEQRLGEQIGKVAGKIISPLLMGKLSRYKPVEATMVAAAMIRADKKNKPGISVYEYADI